MSHASLYVSSKMHDTLKKPREILMVSYAVRSPELAAKSKSIAGEIDVDPAVRMNSAPLAKSNISADCRARTATTLSCGATAS